MHSNENVAMHVAQKSSFGRIQKLLLRFTYFFSRVVLGSIPTLKMLTLRWRLRWSVDGFPGAILLKVSLLCSDPVAMIGFLEHAESCAV